ncbi:unnamed protein product [Fusarium langsethiae]|nr:unnamed protein product [Fusarium langsethiae]
MFPSLLRRPRAGPRRIDRRQNTSASPSPGPARRRYTLERHATADFTEADDDDADFTHDEGLRRFRNNERRTNNDGDEDEEEDDEDDNDGDEEYGMNEDGRQSGLPVLPLFSASHLGMCCYSSSYHTVVKPHG